MKRLDGWTMPWAVGPLRDVDGMLLAGRRLTGHKKVDTAGNREELDRALFDGSGLASFAPSLLRLVSLTRSKHHHCRKAPAYCDRFMIPSKEIKTVSLYIRFLLVAKLHQ